MQEKIEHFYFDREEPHKSCVLTLRDIILDSDENMSEALKYGSPFFLYKGKNFCYCWFDKKSGNPYIGIMKGSKIDHPILYAGDRNTVKIIEIDPEADIPVKDILEVLELARGHY